MKVSAVFCGIFLLCISLHTGGTETLKQEDLMTLIKHLITKMGDMSDRFEKRDNEITKKIENLEMKTIEKVEKVEVSTIEEIEKLEVSTVEDVKKVEVSTAEKIEKLEVSTVERIEKLEVSTIKRVQKVEEQLTEAIRVHDLQIKDEMNFRDLQTKKKMKEMETLFSQRLNEEKQEIEKLKEENAAIKREMKKCIGVKDLSKNVSLLVEKQNDLKVKQIQDESYLRQLEGKINETSIERKDISRKLQITEENVSHIAKVNQGVQREVKSLNNTLHVTEAKLEDEARERKCGIEAVQADQKRDEERLTVITEAMNKTQGSVKEAKNGIKTLNDDTKKMELTVKAFERNMTEKIKGISTLNVTTLSKTVEENKKAIKQFNKEIYQVHMYIRYNQYKNDLGLSFEEVLQLAGEENLVEKNSTIVQKLLKQAKEFRRYKNDWKISYRDVIRLTDGSELNKDTQLLTIRKLVTLDTEFTKNYKRRWGIEFKDRRNSITVLDKIEELYVAFLIKNKIWNIPFKDARQSHALVLVNSWFVQGFADVWGKEAFHSFFHAMMNNGGKRSDFLAKITKITAMERKQRFLKFLPGKFVYEGGKLSVQGYIQMWYFNLTGTVRDKDKSEFNLFTDVAAKTICREAGYSTTPDGWSSGAYRDDTTAYDRSKMRCLLSGLQCKGKNSTIETDCINDQMRPNQPQSNDATKPPTKPPTKPKTTNQPKPPKTNSTPKPPAPETTQSPTTQPPKPSTQPPTTQPPKTTQAPTTHQPTTTPDPWKWHWPHAEDVAIKCNL